MKRSTPPSLSAKSDLASLFERVASILEAGRGRVLQTINHETVLAYWLIGREIVQALQGGEARAQYGDVLIADLSKRLTEHYGSWFLVANLKNFRQFYLTYSDRIVSIGYPLGSQLAASDGLSPISSPAGSESPSVFHPNLSWSHYRSLMRVENIGACPRPDPLLRGKFRRCSLLRAQRQPTTVFRQMPIHLAQRRQTPARNSARGVLIENQMES